MVGGHALDARPQARVRRIARSGYSGSGNVGCPVAGDVVVHEYGEPRGAADGAAARADRGRHDLARRGRALGRRLADAGGRPEGPRRVAALPRRPGLADTAAVVLDDVLRVLDEVRRPGRAGRPLLRRAVRPQGRAGAARPRPGRGARGPRSPRGPASSAGGVRPAQRGVPRRHANPEPEIRRTRAETSWSEAEIAAWAACKTQVDRRLIHHLGLGTVRWRDLIGGVAADPARGAARRRWRRAHCQRRGDDRAHIPGVGHCIRRDDPAAYFGVVDPFLASLDR